MTTDPSRRRLLASLALGAGAVALPRMASAATASEADLSPSFVTIERQLGCRLGVAIHDTGSGRHWLHRADERFPLCSTFKVLAAAAILQQVDRGSDSLDRRVVIRPGDLVDHSPVTSGRTGGNGMTLAELCQAAITTSDNTAGNMMLKAIGGPAGLTAFARTIGDETTRLDRWETALNEAAPGDPRDSTAPAAMADSLRRVLIDDVLTVRSRKELTGWMIANTTGAAKLRAGIPKRWQIGDKTGGGNNGTTNDVAILWPPGGKPVIAAIYITGTTSSMAARDAAIAEIGRAAAAAILA